MCICIYIFIYISLPLFLMGRSRVIRGVCESSNVKSAVSRFFRLYSVTFLSRHAGARARARCLLVRWQEEAVDVKVYVLYPCIRVCYLRLRSEREPPTRCFYY